MRLISLVACALTVSAVSEASLEYSTDADAYTRLWTWLAACEGVLVSLQAVLQLVKALLRCLGLCLSEDSEQSETFSRSVSTAVSESSSKMEDMVRESN